MNDDDEFSVICTCGKCFVTQLPITGSWITLQHGDNPEHVLTISFEEIQSAPSRPGWSRATAQSRYIERRIVEWTDAIHDFEQNGTWAGAPEEGRTL